MKSLSLPLIALVLLGSIPLAPNADAYYSRREVARCNNNAGETAVVGAVLGGILGGLIGSQNGNNGFAGAAIGAAAGGALGLGLSCREEVIYIQHVDHCLDEEDYRNPYAWNEGSVEITRDFQNRDGSLCREYHARYDSPNGSVQKDEIACRSGNTWMHGYNARDLRVTRDYRHSESHYSNGYGGHSEQHSSYRETRTYGAQSRYYPQQPSYYPEQPRQYRERPQYDEQDNEDQSDDNNYSRDGR
jgi:hypothetical protein